MSGISFDIHTGSGPKSFWGQVIFFLFLGCACLFAGYLFSFWFYIAGAVIIAPCIFAIIRRIVKKSKSNIESH